MGINALQQKKDQFQGKKASLYAQRSYKIIEKAMQNIIVVLLEQSVRMIIIRTLWTKIVAYQKSIQSIKQGKKWATIKGWLTIQGSKIDK